VCLFQSLTKFKSMSDLQIKVCGMKEPRNILDVAMLKPEYMGFILYRHSERHISLKDVIKVSGEIPEGIMKVGVIVNEPVENAKKIARSRVFDLLQLHGNESAGYCRDLSGVIKIIKAFSIAGSLPEKLPEYQAYCSMFIFDAAGAGFGGNGKKFDHGILQNYSLDTPYLLSGGISPDDSGYIMTLKNYRMSGVDLNSRFESQPGVKNIELLKKFIKNIRGYDEQN
jgi:phosphoribosylanthranilate isomerase